MSITDSLSSISEICGEHYTIARARDVFSRMRDRCPKEYEEKRLSIRQAAELLNVDTRTIRQRIAAKLIKPKIEVADNGYKKRALVSVRDLADMLIEKPLKYCAGKNQRRYTAEEVDELRTTKKVVGRTYNSYKVKAWRLGISLKK